MEILTADELAARLKFDKGTIYKLARTGKIPSLKIAGSIRFNWTDIQKSVLSIDSKCNEIRDRA